jgi:AmiR/NasT family two-component response regulator
MRSTPPSALLISPVDEDHDFLCHLFFEQVWTLYSTPTLPSEWTLMKVPVLITGTELQLGTWRDVLEVVSALPNAPHVIVASRRADEYLWAEALNLGAHGVLVKPFDKTEVIRVLNFAWIPSERRRLTRKTLGA